MMNKLLTGMLGAMVLGLGAQSAAAAEEGKALPEYHWTFDGIFGHFDRAAAQRGLQVYREVCATCHSLRFVAFRDLAALGYDEEQIKSFAAEATVTDGPNEDGEVELRVAQPDPTGRAPGVRFRLALPVAR